MPNADVDWALAELRDSRRLARYDLTRAYYLGDHRLNFSNERFRDVFKSKFQAATDNLMPAIVDAVADRLEIIDFQSNRTRAQSDGTRSDPMGRRAVELWQRNRMDLYAYETHQEALITGDGYIIVDTDRFGRARLWPQVAHEMAVEYDREQPGRIIRAAKVWRRADKKLRVNVYFENRLERWVSEKEARSYGPPMRWTSQAFVPYTDEPLELAIDPTTSDDLASIGAIPNPWGRVPVFHFPNRSNERYGLSELLDPIPLQDALNKTLCDRLIAQEFSSYRQRYVAGIEVAIDPVTGKPLAKPFDPGADKLWAVNNPDVKFGEFGATDLGQFVEAEENLRAEIARVSGTPLHYLFITKGDYPSGEAMKSAEARFTKKMRRAQALWGNVWEDVVTFALMVDGTTIPEGLELSAVWLDASPRSEKEKAETAVLLKAAGVSRTERLRSLEYDEASIAEQLLEGPEEAVTPAAGLPAGNESAQEPSPAV